MKISPMIKTVTCITYSALILLSIVILWCVFFASSYESFIDIEDIDPATLQQIFALFQALGYGGGAATPNEDDDDDDPTPNEDDPTPNDDSTTTPENEWADGINPDAGKACTTETASGDPGFEDAGDKKITVDGQKARLWGSEPGKLWDSENGNPKATWKNAFPGCDISTDACIPETRVRYSRRLYDESDNVVDKSAISGDLSAAKEAAQNGRIKWMKCVKR